MKSTALAVLAVMAAVACNSAGDKADTADSTQPGSPSGGGADLTGAGATFPYPLYSKWASVYMNETGQRINYQSLGSGAGVNQISEGTVDFGASDGPMTDAELAKARYGPIVHIPTILGAVVVTYNLPGVTQTLRMTPDIVADIFLGRITKWNDPRIVANNAGVALPNSNILVVHRSDGSGTTYVFTDYLTSVSPAWASGPGRGKAVSWPTGLGGRGNEGVAAQVQQTPGALGYVELAYAMQNRQPAAAIRNASGNFVEPAIASITAAAAGVADTLAADTDYRISIVNAPGPDAYPISSFTWILLYQQQRNAEKGRKLVGFLRWAITDGQKHAADLHYAPLPSGIVTGVQKKLDAIALGAP